MLTGDKRGGGVGEEMVGWVPMGESSYIVSLGTGSVEEVDLYVHPKLEAIVGVNIFN